jgi:hypothetical protein
MPRCDCRLVLLLGSALLLSWSAPARTASVDWQKVAPADAGLSPDLALRLDPVVRDGRLPNLHAVVARGSRLVLERYYDGQDERWGESFGTAAFGPGVKHELRLVSKSIVGLLSGVALAEGPVPALAQPLVDHFGTPTSPTRSRRRSL